MFSLQVAPTLWRYFPRAVGRVISVVCDCVCLSVCLCVRAVKDKRLELSTPNLVDTQCIAVAGHALTLKSKGQRSKLCGYQMLCLLGYACQQDCQNFLFSSIFLFFASLLVTLSTVIGGQFIEPCDFSGSLSLLVFFYVYFAVLYYCEK